jgi:hypothetical protein
MNNVGFAKLSWMTMKERGKIELITTLNIRSIAYVF